MRAWFRLLSVFLLSTTFSDTILPLAAAPQPDCGIRQGAICFSLQDGENHVLGRYVDFTVDEVSLRSAGHVAIYQGIGLSEQDDVTDIKVVKSYDAPTAHIDIHSGGSPDGPYFDIHAKLKPEQWGVVQIFGYIKDKAAAGAIAQFVSGIRACKSTNPNDGCSSDQAFQDAAEFIRGLAN